MAAEQSEQSLTTATLPVYRLRSQGLTPRNVCLLAPLGFAYLWAPKSISVTGPKFWMACVASGLMLAIGLIGLVYVLTPVELEADEHGVRWRDFFKRKQFCWAEIESIGVAVSRGTEGWDRPVPRVLTMGMSAAMRFPPTIGINLRNEAENAATQAYRRGFTGYELCLANAFWPSTEDIVEELSRRLEAYRQRQDTSRAADKPPILARAGGRLPPSP